MDNMINADELRHEGVEPWVRRAAELAQAVPWDTAPPWATHYKVVYNHGLWMNAAQKAEQILVAPLFFLSQEESQSMPPNLRVVARPSPKSNDNVWEPSGRATSNTLRHKLESAYVGEVVRVGGELGELVRVGDEPWRMFEVPIGVDVSEEKADPHAWRDVAVRSDWSREPVTAEEKAQAHAEAAAAGRGTQTPAFGDTGTPYSSDMVLDGNTIKCRPLYGGSALGGQPNTVVDVDTPDGEALLRKDTEERMRKATDPQSFGGITLGNILATRQCQQAAASYVDLVRKMQEMRDRLRESQAKQAAIEQEFTLLMERTTYARHALLRQILRQNGVDVSEGATHV